MSSYYLRCDRPHVGDLARHPRYGEVSLQNCLMCTVDTGEFWIAKTEDGEYVIVHEEDLEDIGYFGD